MQESNLPARAANSSEASARAKTRISLSDIDIADGSGRLLALLVRTCLPRRSSSARRLTWTGSSFGQVRHGAHSLDHNFRRVKQWSQNEAGREKLAIPWRTFSDRLTMCFSQYNPWHFEHCPQRPSIHPSIPHMPWRLRNIARSRNTRWAARSTCLFRQISRTHMCSLSATFP